MNSSPEVLVLDTGVVSILGTRRRKPERVSHWPRESLSRIDAAIKVISFATRAEIDAGLLDPRLDSRFVERERRRTATLPVLPLDQPTMDEWARFSEHLRRKGVTIGHNDLWVAATASSRGLTVVTCDGDLMRLADEIDVVYLPVNVDTPPPPGP